MNKESQSEIVPKFDPNKAYEWKPTDKFVISGEEYGAILHALRTQLQTKEAQAIFAAKEASEALHEVLIRAVENGVAKEMKDDKKG